jgi:hypothetical protein
MESRAALISGLLILGMLTIWYGAVSWVFSVLARYGMPAEVYLIVAGFLTIVFAMLGARLFAKE